MVKIGGTTLIERIILQLRDAGIKEIIINVSYLKEQIIDTVKDGRRYDVSITFQVESPGPKETAGAIKYAVEMGALRPGIKILTVNSDIYTNFEFEKIIATKVNNAHLVLVRNPDHNKNGDFSLENGIISCGKNKHTYSGIGIYDTNFITRNFTSPKLGQLLRDSLDKKYVSGELYDGIWHDVGTIARLKYLQEIYKKT